MSNLAFRPLDPEGIEQVAELTMKLLFAGDSSNGDSELGAGQSYISIKEDVLALVASLTNVITVSQQYGISLSGPVSFSAMPDQISLGGGYWKINPLVLTGLPSTNATPIPWLIPAEPKLLSGASEVEEAIGFLLSFSDIG